MNWNLNPNKSPCFFIFLPAEHATSQSCPVQPGEHEHVPSMELHWLFAWAHVHVYWQLTPNFPAEQAMKQIQIITLENKDMHSMITLWAIISNVSGFALASSVCWLARSSVLAIACLRATNAPLSVWTLAVAFHSKPALKCYVFFVCQNKTVRSRLALTTRHWHWPEIWLHCSAVTWESQSHVFFNKNIYYTLKSDLLLTSLQRSPKVPGRQLVSHAAP